MPAILLSDAISDQLRLLVADTAATDDEALHLLRRQLNRPPRPSDGQAHYAKGTVVTHACLVGVARWARASESALELSLDMLLRGAHVAVPVTPKPQRSAALIEALRKIEIDQEQREYEAMLPAQDVRQHRPLLDTLRGAPMRIGTTHRIPGQGLSKDEQEWLEVRQQLSAIANILVSVMAVATAVWWAGGTADPIWKTLVALPVSILVAIAETALYARHWSNLRKRRESIAKRQS